MGTISRFEDIEAWRKARELTRAIYGVTNAIGFNKDFKLKDQIRSASVSIMSNIAEGYERDGTKEFIQFLAIAKGSVGEVRSQLYVALDAGYLTQQEFDQLKNLAIDVSRMLNSFMRYLKQCNMPGEKYRT